MMASKLLNFPERKDSAKEIIDAIKELVDEAEPKEPVEVIAIVRVGTRYTTLTSRSEDVIKFVGMVELFKLELLEMMND